MENKVLEFKQKEENIPWIDWWGLYYGLLIGLPLLIASFLLNIIGG